MCRTTDTCSGCILCASAFTDRWTHPPTQTHSPTNTPPLFLNLLVRLWNLFGWLPGDCCPLLEYWSYSSPTAPVLSFHLSMSSFHPNIEVSNNRRMRAARKHTHCLTRPWSQPFESFNLFICLTFCIHFIFKNILRFSGSWIDHFLNLLLPCNNNITKTKHPHNSHISVWDQTPIE